MFQNRIDNLDASDDVKAYLRRVSKESHAIFRRGHIAEQQTSSHNKTQTVSNPVPSPPTATTFVPRLPVKKRARNDDSDEEDVVLSTTAPCTSKTDASAPPAACSTSPVASSNTSALPNLVAKWCLLASYQHVVVPTAALPSSDFVEDTVQTFLRLRERVAQSQIGVELLKDKNEEEWEAAIPIIEQYFGFRGAHTKTAVQSFRKKFQLKIEALETPNTPKPQLWYAFMEGSNGPMNGKGPSLTMMATLDQAHANTALHVIMSKLKRGAANESFVAPSTTRMEDTDSDDGPEAAPLQGSARVDKTSDDDAIVGTFFVNDADNDEEEEEDSFVKWSPNDGTQSFSSSYDTHLVELLRFLRYLMPCQNTVTGRGDSCGLGVWWFALAASVDLLVDPDTDRMLHNLFRSVCQHLRVFHEVISKRTSLPADRGAMVEYLRGINTCVNDARAKAYWTVDDVDLHDVLALQTILVLLAKVFKQNQNHFLAM